MAGAKCRPGSRRWRRCCVLRNTDETWNVERGTRNRIGDFGSTFRLPRSAFGFTLIELLVVITVIAILAGLVAPMVFRNVGDAKVSAAKAQLELFGLALDAYRLDNDYYPSSAQGLAALRARPAGTPDARNWRGPYVRKDIPLDPWGRPYVYKAQ